MKKYEQYLEKNKSLIEKSLEIDNKKWEESFNIDKKWIEKKLKKRSIKTDNGFDIKGDLTDFEDPMKYSVRQNPDGSIDIVIKNVRFYEEK